MAFDFLDTTTLDPEIAQQQDLINMMSSQAATQNGDPNDIRNLDEMDDNDLTQIDEEDNDHEELSDADADKMATDTHDFENEDLDAVDYQLMGYIMGDSDQQQPQAPKQQMQYGGGTLGGASTVYSQQSAPWLQNRVNNIKFSATRPSQKYTPQLPYGPGGRSDTAYQRIQDTAIKTITNDPIAQKLGVNVTPTAKVGGAYNTDYQMGGKTLFADSEATLRTGLNNDNYHRAVLNLKGTNTIRGLDNGQPVAVSDGSKYKILTGPQDTAQFNGKVYEKRM